MEVTILYALPQNAGQRIDLFISQELPTLTRTAAQKLCASGLVLVGGRVCEKNLRLKGGEEVAVRVPAPRPLKTPAQEIPLDIVYEDDSLIVLNKAQGLVVHPGPGNEEGTLVNALLFYCGPGLSGIGGVERPGIVHRLDKMTSGLLVVAKTQQAHLNLSAQMKDRKALKLYEAVVYGCPKEEAGRVEAPIGRHPTDRKKMSVNHKNGREAATVYRVLTRYRGFSHLELRLETGRTHQIRVHLAGIGHPVAGDAVYGPRKPIAPLRGQCLHAKTLGIYHPVSGQYLEFTSLLPDYFTRFLEQIQKG